MVVHCNFLLSHETRHLAQIQGGSSDWLTDVKSERTKNEVNNQVLNSVDFELVTFNIKRKNY